MSNKNNITKRLEALYAAQKRDPTNRGVNKGIKKLEKKLANLDSSNESNKGRHLSDF